MGRSRVSWLCARLWPLAGAEGRKVRSGQGRVGLAACSLGVLMLLTDPCAQREPDRRACLIHESPAGGCFGALVALSFSASEEDHPRAPRRSCPMWGSGRAHLCPGVETVLHFTVSSKDRKFNPHNASLQKSYSCTVMFVDLVSHRFCFKSIRAGEVMDFRGANETVTICFLSIAVRAVTVKHWDQ